MSGITSEDRKWALKNLGSAMMDLANNSPEKDLGAIMNIKAALTHLGQSDLMKAEYIPQVLQGGYEEVEGHD